VNREDAAAGKLSLLVSQLHRAARVLALVRSLGATPTAGGDPALFPGSASRPHRCRRRRASTPEFPTFVLHPLEHRMPVSTVGLFVGLLLGVAAAAGGFAAFVYTIVLAVIGLVVGKVLDGQLDLAPYLSGRSGRNR